MTATRIARHPNDFSATAKPLTLGADEAFVRGLEHCDDAAFANLARLIADLQAPVRYSNEDGDRRARVYCAIHAMRALGNSPLKTIHERLDDIAASRMPRAAA